MPTNAKPKMNLSSIPQPEAERAQLRDAIQAKLHYVIGKNRDTASHFDWYFATALAVRDRIVDIWMKADQRATQQQKKRVYYLSIEFLIGRLLFDALSNLGLVEPARAALRSLGIDLDDLRRCEPDAALGNGGLGRLAACFMDSMSALAIPAYGYGIRYENGLFDQRIVDGWQHESPEDWLARGNPWEFPRAGLEYTIGFGGSVEYIGGDEGTARAIWYPSEQVLALPYDTPITGWRGRHVNALRLWSARAAHPVQLSAFNKGDYVGAVAARARAEAISRVLYPNDAMLEGQELRLRQEYFFTSASLQDLTQRHIAEFGSLESLPEHAAVQLNDTHPAIAVAELVRILVDEHEFSWENAWAITKRTLNYTNHTLLPEALETWPADLLGRLLPRHLQIIYLINWLHLEETSKRGKTDSHFLASVSLVKEDGNKRVRMAHLAFLGSRSVNGVSALHTDLLRRNVFHDLAETTTTRMVNVTNGVTFRRWLFEANPGLTKLLIERIGDEFLDDPRHLERLKPLADDEGFAEHVRRARLANKSRLASAILEATGIRVEPHALFDVHIKRIHEYKRQLLNVLEAIAYYDELRADPNAHPVPRVKILSGKAAASYGRAKLIIKLINDVAEVVNNDPAVRDRLKIVFMPNYNASLAEVIIPAADLSEQISTAGMEASGTGNMKLALNGALTIGTLDGANIEIAEHVGRANVAIFGMTAAEVAEKVREQFPGRAAVENSPRLSAALDMLAGGAFSPDDPHRFRPIVDSLMDFDRYMVAADFEAYWAAQRDIDRLWQTPQAWWRKSILNTASMAWFSSDRSIRDYAREIWNVPVD
jgi:glycogen phosphorylase